MVRNVLVALDESQASRAALDYALRGVLPRPAGAANLHLVTVLPTVQTPIAVPPMASAAAMNVLHCQWGAQQQANHARAHELLRKMSEVAVNDYRTPAESVHRHALPALGGASGVGQSLVEAAAKLRADVLVLGTRGMGALQASLMTLMGLGSVSDYCLHNARCPVMVVRQSKDTVLGAEASPPAVHAPPPKRVMVCTDDSPHAKKALQWYLDCLVMPNDHLHLVSVALLPPALPLDEPAVVAAVEEMAADEEARGVVSDTASTVACAQQQALAHGVLRTRVATAVLAPEPGVSDVGQALCSYARDKNVGLAVVGSRGLGMWQRSVMGALGLGSVSDFLSRHLPCALLVVKDGGARRESHEESGMLLQRVPEEDRELMGGADAKDDGKQDGELGGAAVVDHGKQD